MPYKKSRTTNTPNIDPCRKKLIYLDNNGTTKMCKSSKDAMIKWLDSRSNPSSDSILATKSKELVSCARNYMLKHCSTNGKTYTVIFTSGASESNCLILLSVADAYKKHTGRKPHIITSATEHKSIIQCCNNLKKNNRADITFIEPNAYGFIDPQLILRSINSNTALVSIMAANNELGTINNIYQIGKITDDKKVPFHTDAVQLFGKYKIPLGRNKIDALSMSFHKLYGPMGLGMLIVSNNLIKGYDLKGQISGSQQFELRGGTENVPAIAAAVACTGDTFKNRELKNKKMYELKKRFILELEKHIPQGMYESYFQKKKPNQNEFVILGPKCNNNIRNPNVLPNTLLISFVKNIGETKFCNIDLKKHLNKKDIVVSVGSACSTISEKASHVLYSIKAPPVIKQGVIRISLSDHTTLKEIITAVKEIIIAVKNQFKK
jgi:cysteine desulfurase